jgi:sugar phosphate isomerase/epimerase
MLSRAVKAPRPLIALSTASVFPDRTPDAFEVAARLGYDGVEVMVSADAISQDVEVIRRLVDYHGIPVLAVHAPCLLITQRVWGYEPWGKLIRAKEMAEKLGARVVVVHPPFRWQRDYAKDFGPGLERMREETDVVFAVENMYPLRAGGAEMAPYAPSWNPVLMDSPHVTLDLSHTAVSGSDALEMAGELGDRLAHVHMADGSGVANRDEHLVPGRGTQPCAPVLEKLAADGYSGAVVLEVNTRRAVSREARLADLSESLEFTRKHLGDPAGASGGRARAGDRQSQPRDRQSQPRDRQPQPGDGPARAGGPARTSNGPARARDGRAQAGGRAGRAASPGPATGPDQAGQRGPVLPACR